MLKLRQTLATKKGGFADPFGPVLRKRILIRWQVSEANVLV